VLSSASTLSGPKPSRVSLEHFTGGFYPPPIPIDPKSRSRQIGIGGHANSESPVTLNRNARSRSTGIRNYTYFKGVSIMGRGILLWMLGVPLPIILLLAMCSHR
jgi:hypothetical protein